MSPRIKPFKATETGSDKSRILLAILLLTILLVMNFVVKASGLPFEDEDKVYINTTPSAALTVKGTIIDSRNGVPLSGFSVILTQRGVGQELNEEVVLTNNHGEYEIPIAPDKIYQISFEQGYQQSSMLLSSRGRKSGTIMQNFYLEQPLLAHAWR